MYNIGKKILCGVCAVLLYPALFADDTATPAPAENGSGRPEQPAPIPPQRELIMIESVFEYDLNPHSANYSTEAQILSGLYEGLFSYNPQTLDPDPAIAESFRISRNKLTWTFTLKKDAVFSDGTPITAETFRTAWLELLSPAHASPFGSLLDCIAGAEAYRTGTGTADGVGIKADGYTLTVKLNAPTEHLAKLLCHHAFSAVIPGTQLYSGAFTLASYTPSEIVLAKNQQYRNAHKTLLPGVRIILSDDSEANTYLFNTGNADWISSGDVEIQHILDRRMISFSTQFGTEYLFFKADKAPWNDPRVRNALLYAVPWEQLRPENDMKAETLIVPLRGYPDIAGIGDRDLDMSKSLLEEAGVAGTPLQLVFAIPDTEYMRNQAELLQKAWAEIGVEVAVRKTPSNRYLQSIPGWNADLFTYTWIGDFADPLAFLELFRGGSSLNETAWNDPAYNLLLEEASRLQDGHDRYQKLSEAEQYLLDAGLILPISHPLAFNVIDRSVLNGWYDNALDIHPFKYMYFTEPEQKMKIAKP